MRYQTITIIPGLNELYDKRSRLTFLFNISKSGENVWITYTRTCNADFV